MNLHIVGLGAWWSRLLQQFGEFGEFEESTQGGVVDDIGNQQTPFILKASSVFHSIFKSSETESEVIVEDSNADLDVINLHVIGNIARCRLVVELIRIKENSP